MKAATTEPFEAWDPLESTGGADPGILISAQKREISNILKSYTGYYDLFSELIQNALDAVEKKYDGIDDSNGHIWISIDLRNNEVRVTDNGCGMDIQQFRQFLRPNFSFKAGKVSRGSKGVGATYLGYGFNYLHISTKADKLYSGKIENGRNWVDDVTGTIGRPKLSPSSPAAASFHALESGTEVTIRLIGSNIRPRDLAWNHANNADQWLALLRVLTPAGGVYLSKAKAHRTSITVYVVDQLGKESVSTIHEPKYMFPHTVIKQSANLRKFLIEQSQRTQQGIDPSKIPPAFTKLNGLWGEWSTDELLTPTGPDCPIQVRLDQNEKELAKASGISLYVYLAFSTELWDNLSDQQLKLRKGTRLLHGGLQLATRNMPQGITLTIPMTNNIGFQNLAHAIVHFDNAEPDLGRKGFQPEFVHLAEKIAVSAVTAFRRRHFLLRKAGVAKIFDDELKIDEWIREQEKHESVNSLIIKGSGLFMPTEELPIRSEPLVEQDVVALFNQMLSSGLIRGVQLIASSQYNQYDGLFRVRMDPPIRQIYTVRRQPSWN